MTKKIKVSVVFLVTLALSPVAGASAAGSWFVEGKELSSESEVAIAPLVHVDGQTKIISPRLSLSISCTTEVDFTKGGIISRILRIPHPVFLGCTEVQPKTCKLGSTAIEMEEVSGFVTTTGLAPKDRLILKASAGTLLATLIFEGTCAFAGEQPLNGSITAEISDGQNEQQTHQWDFIGSLEENNSLEIAKNKAFFEQSKLLVKLTSGQKWSFH